MARRHGRVHETALDIIPGTDMRAPGGAVTAGLCGRWDHDGPCRWPHHNDLDAGTTPSLLRTVFVCDDADETEVRARIDSALLGSDAWSVHASGPADPTAAERALAARLGAAAG